MNDMLGVVFFALWIIIPASVIGTVIYLIYSLSRNKGNTKPMKITSKTLFQIYLYLISIITLGLTVLGGATAIKAGLSFQYDIPFSYTLYKASSFAEEKIYNPEMRIDGFQECYEGEAIDAYGKKFCFDYSTRVSDLINGITLFTSMSILFLIHQFALSRISEEKRIHGLKKIYTFASLIIYSLIGIISIPTAIYQFANYLVFDAQNISHSTPTAPAMAIALAILSLPLWIFFLFKVSNMKEK
jgi:hypothetical protein